MTPCALVPVYDQPRRLGEVLAGLRAHGLAVVVVDDGSALPTRATLAALAAADPDLKVVTLPANRGKGVAVAAGLDAAAAAGYSHAVQIDADGQHDLAALPALLAQARAEPGALVSGAPRYDSSMPRARRYGRWITHVWVWVETLSTRLVDSMCGFRVYPIAATREVIAAGGIGPRMDFDTSVMVRWYWTGRPVVFVPVAVSYPPDGISHFRPWRDNLRISWMHTRLVLGMLPRIPRLLRLRTGASAWPTMAERGHAFGVGFVTACATLLGRRATHLVLWPIAIWYALFDARVRRASLDYLARVAPRIAPDQRADCRPDTLGALRHVHTFATLAVDKLIAWRDPTALERMVEPLAAPSTALATGGALLVGSHHGNLDLCRALAHTRPDLDLTALVYGTNSRRFVAAMMRANPAWAERLVQVDAIGPGTAMLLRERIARGELVVIVGDRTPVDPTSPTVVAPFLGALAPFAIGPWVLAHALECPVRLIHCVRDAAGRYRMELEPFSDRIVLPRATRAAALAAVVADYARRLEARVVQAPLQWGNLYDFWAPRSSTAAEGAE